MTKQIKLSKSLANNLKERIKKTTLRLEEIQIDIFKTNRRQDNDEKQYILKRLQGDKLIEITHLDFLKTKLIQEYEFIIQATVIK